MASVMAWFLKLASAYPEVLATVVCFFILLLYSKNRFPYPAMNWPFLGQVPTVIANFYRYYEWAEEHVHFVGCTYKFKGPWFANMDILGTVDPANINHIFNTNFQNYPKGKEFSEIFDFLGDGIFNADFESWKSQRKEAHSLMSDIRFRRLVAKTSMEKVAKALIPVLSRAAENGSVLDLQDVFLRFTFDTTSTVVIGHDPGCLSLDMPSVPFANAMDDAEDVAFFRHAMPILCLKLVKWLRLGQERRMARACQTIKNFMVKWIAEKIEQMKNEDEGGEQDDSVAPDMICSLLKNRPELREDGTGSKYLYDMALNLILAGRDTTSTALAWFFWMITQHPEVERKILDELSPIAAAHAGETKPIIFKPEELNSNVYLLAALHESLRLFPPVPHEHKSARETDVLPTGHKIEAGEKILINLHSMARAEGVWGKDCRDFRPERWITERGTLKHEPSYKFLSFNSGPRTCLGKDMAFSQMKVVAATMIHNFRIKAVPGQVVRPKLSIILHMKSGLKVTVENRV